MLSRVRLFCVIVPVLPSTLTAMKLTHRSLVPSGQNLTAGVWSLEALISIQLFCYPEAQVQKHLLPIVSDLTFVHATEAISHTVLGSAQFKM